MITDYYSDYNVITHSTPQYSPPEQILQREQRLEKNRAEISAWALGCILYLLDTGKHAFPDFASLMDYQYNGIGPPKISSDCNPKLNSNSRKINDDEKKHLSKMWNSVRDFLIGDKESLDRDSRRRQVSEMIDASLSRDIETRPSVKQIEMHASANAVRSRLEEREACSLQQRS